MHKSPMRIEPLANRPSGFLSRLGLTKSGAIGAFIGAVFGILIGIGTATILPNLIGGTLIGAGVSEWIADVAKRKADKTQNA